MNSSDWIKLLRTKNKISQTSFAKQTGISSNYLSLIENGKKKPTFRYLQKVSDIFDVPVNLFIWDEIDYSKVKDKKTRKLVIEIDKTIEEIKKEIIRKLIR
jgi:transcriptional regulator with XRE-family HTH domain